MKKLSLLAILLLTLPAYTLLNSQTPVPDQTWKLDQSSLTYHMSHPMHEDSNRDLHMIQTTRGAQFPIVQVRFRLAQATLNSPTLDCDLEVQFAGNSAHYSHVIFQQSIDGAAHHITGVVPATLNDFKIDPPSFLTIPIKNAIPVRVDMVWHAM